MPDTSYTVGPAGVGAPVTGTVDPLGGAAPVIYSFIAGCVRVSPPWLRRAVGGAIMRSLGTPIEEQTERNVLGIGLRFPSGSQPDALGAIGAERRILRGPGESSVTYAARLRTWLDAHRTRGGGFALASQLYAYFVTALGVPVDIIGETGVNHSIAADGTITRNVIDSWVGSATWARFYVILNLDAETYPVPDLSDTGEPLGTFTQVALGALTDAERASICAVISDWSPAHIARARAILLPPGAELWDYAGPGLIGDAVGTWDEDPLATWDDSDVAVEIDC